MLLGCARHDPGSDVTLRIQQIGKRLELVEKRVAHEPELHTQVHKVRIEFANWRVARERMHAQFEVSGISLGREFSQLELNQLEAMSAQFRQLEEIIEKVNESRRL